MTDTDIPIPTDAAAPALPAGQATGDPVELDLQALRVHFQGYEISDPVTVALRPIIIASAPGASAMGRR